MKPAASVLIPPPPWDGATRQRLACALVEGEVMVYPTETAYAIGGNALHEGLHRRLYHIKGRAAAKAMPLIVSGLPMARLLAREITPPVSALMEAFWPGPLTLILHAAPDAPAHLADSRGTLALRWSPHPVLAALFALHDVPLVATSANPSSQAPAYSVQTAREHFGQQVAVYVSGLEGQSPEPVPPSTLLDTTQVPYRLLRAGPITQDMLWEVLRGPYAPYAPLPMEGVH